jgi:peptidoglycan L-alanyl-D-glutamate endopeptidase CwlK
MSQPLFAQDILFLQRFLKCCELYDGPLDGQFNADVGKGEDSLAAKYQSIKLETGNFDARSEACIMTLQPDAQRKAREFLNAAMTLPLTYKIISGTRTYAEQDELFAHGRTKPGPRVTNAKGGESNHNFGIAWDVGIFDNGKYLTGATHEEEQAYIDLGKHILANATGLEWGGNWHDFVDRPHYQLATVQTVAVVRQLFESGTAIV